MAEVTITATWDAVADAEGYRFYQGEQLLEVLGGTLYEYVTELEDGTYEFSVEAYNKHGTGPKSTTTRTFESQQTASEGSEVVA